MQAGKPTGCVRIRCADSFGRPVDGLVTVTNICGETVFRGLTRGGEAAFRVCRRAEYRIRVEAGRCYSPASASRWAVLGPGSGGSFCFVFGAAEPSVPAAFLLTDRNYGGLPISKGAVYLWRTPISSTSQTA